jgi:hypothetical protein
MKNLILLIILFFLFEHCFITPVFSQEQRVSDLSLYKIQMSNHLYQLENSIQGITKPISFSKADTTRPRAHAVNEPWYKPWLDFSFLSKLSGPGPFAGLGFEYPVFIFARDFSLYAGISFSHSLDNTLQYYKTDSAYARDSINGVVFYTLVHYDSCVACRDNKGVTIFSLQVDAQYHFPGSDFDIYGGLGFNEFFGDAFTSFSRASGSFGASWYTPLKYIKVGLMFNLYKKFNPNSFGAVNNSAIKNTVEIVPGAFIKVGL